MTSQQNLPTRADIFANALSDLDVARNGLSSSRDWLQSDWQPAGAVLTDAAATGRTEARRLIAEAKDLIDQAKRALYDGLETL
ncbi:hypothetical protein AB0C65_38300 [Nocardia sp. NPDC048505]|uniref:hypothetical protein n=1 Tax=Nocardia sp. NPDC048505 TaxID=3155756 RepID=UPI0033FF9A5B